MRTRLEIINLWKRHLPTFGNGYKMKNEKTQKSKAANGKKRRVKQSTPEWQRRFQEWVDSRPKTSNCVDTDRDKIYGLRGL